MCSWVIALSCHFGFKNCVRVLELPTTYPNCPLVRCLAPTLKGILQESVSDRDPDILTLEACLSDLGKKFDSGRLVSHTFVAGFFDDAAHFRDELGLDWPRQQQWAHFFFEECSRSIHREIENDPYVIPPPAQQDWGTQPWHPQGLGLAGSTLPTELRFTRAAMSSKKDVLKGRVLRDSTS